MWQFNWGVFWPILLVAILIVYLSNQLEALNRCLLDIEQRLKEMKSSALFRDAEARKGQARLDRVFAEEHAKEPLIPYPAESMQDLEKDVLPVRPPEGLWEIREQLQSIAKILERLRSPLSWVESTKEERQHTTEQERRQSEERKKRWFELSQDIRKKFVQEHSGGWKRARVLCRRYISSSPEYELVFADTETTYTVRGDLKEYWSEEEFSLDISNLPELSEEVRYARSGFSVFFENSKGMILNFTLAEERPNRLAGSASGE